ncbi:hypothetical protein CR513_53528, partial [Mucuna pruriens]
MAYKATSRSLMCKALPLSLKKIAFNELKDKCIIAFHTSKTRPKTKANLKRSTKELMSHSRIT